MDQRAYLHLCDEPFTRSSVSVISFYTGLHEQRCRVPPHRGPRTDIQHWKAGSEHEIRLQWDVDDGVALRWMDGEEKDRRGVIPLDRIRPHCLSSLRF
ncbi:MAG TPA: hypothetical protein EYM39_07050 [Candidatus Latescibacteria bacterium]|nr:hypothetical protein [Candidatus Latescibacterota bacterium]